MFNFNFYSIINHGTDRFVLNDKVSREFSYFEFKLSNFQQNLTDKQLTMHYLNSELHE